ncbi:MAG TPA: 3-hydroxybutyrate dehydrogenase [Ramlibacter sp.]|uniref:3-hydroxybutyrate dehydrogenase n=1 Tax=Ramlibacter sp. TaxID=1917967 RepID=UPI002D8084D6|nr:3-hydroxybutyrate dehydrogenase [Ramlibacter sp.]HET8747945.1 3-hydroxybutyrate dehydrogenase [Ramlibacter sp.]
MAASASGGLEGRVALVTGSTDGIGLAVARSLAAQGSAVMLNGFGEPEAIRALCDELATAHGVEVAHAPADLRREEDAAALVPHVLERFGRLDVVVNNAGTQHKGPVEEHPPQRWREVFALNLDAAFHTIRTALPGMRARGWGRIVNVASVYGLAGGVDRSSYVASKHALVGLTKAVALETASTPITCNAVCPGDVSTRIFYRNAKLLAESEGISRAEAQQRIAATNMPSGRVVAPEHVAALVAFLCSEAAGEIRGAALPVDGAWLAR